MVPSVSQGACASGTMLTTGVVRPRRSRRHILGLEGRRALADALRGHGFSFGAVRSTGEMYHRLPSETLVGAGGIGCGPVR